jgi:geranylgeranyl pyrophosphate synthase
MKALERNAEVDGDLSELLERCFLSGDDTDSVLARTVPRAIWNHALLDPLRDFLRRPSKQFRAHLVELGYRLGGGRVDTHPIELPLIIECLHAGSLIIDDIEDASTLRRDAPALHRAYGVPRALNAGNWLYFWPQVLLCRLPLSERARLAAHERVALCLMHCHEGQALDLSVRAAELKQSEVLPVVRAITRLKTGGLLGLATGLGAIAAGASAERVELIAGLGRELGVGLQMLDDVSGVLSGTRRHKAVEDLRHGRATWIWAWLADELDHRAYETLQSEARAVASAEPATGNAACDALIERMRFRVGTLGLRHARNHVSTAVTNLAQVIGHATWCDEVLEQFGWLERRYVHG